MICSIYIFNYVIVIKALTPARHDHVVVNRSGRRHVSVAFVWYNRFSYCRGFHFVAVMAISPINKLEHHLPVVYVWRYFTKSRISLYMWKSDVDISELAISLYDNCNKIRFGFWHACGDRQPACVDIGNEVIFVAWCKNKCMADDMNLIFQY